jgi:hypothetical protein
MPEPEAPEPFLQVGDRVAGVTLTKREEVSFAPLGGRMAHRDEPRSGPIISNMVGDPNTSGIA